MGKVVVKYFGYLADYAGGREKVVEVEGRVPVEEVIELPPDVTIEDVVVLVNGKPAKPGQLVGDGDEVSVLPHISGG